MILTWFYLFCKCCRFAFVLLVESSRRKVVSPAILRAKIALPDESRRSRPAFQGSLLLHAQSRLSLPEIELRITKTSKPIGYTSPSSNHVRTMVRDMEDKIIPKQGRSSLCYKQTSNMNEVYDCLKIFTSLHLHLQLGT